MNKICFLKVTRTFLNSFNILFYLIYLIILFKAIPAYYNEETMYVLYVNSSKITHS